MIKVVRLLCDSKEDVGDMLGFIHLHTDGVWSRGHICLCTFQGQEGGEG